MLKYRHFSASVLPKNILVMLFQLFFNTENITFRFYALSTISHVGCVLLACFKSLLFSRNAALFLAPDKKIRATDIESLRNTTDDERGWSVVTYTAEKSIVPLLSDRSSFFQRDGLPAAVKAADKKGVTINLPSASSDRKRSLARNTRTWVRRTERERAGNDREEEKKYNGNERQERKRVTRAGRRVGLYRRRRLPQLRSPLDTWHVNSCRGQAHLFHSACSLPFTEPFPRVLYLFSSPFSSLRCCTRPRRATRYSWMLYVTLVSWRNKA